MIAENNQIQDRVLLNGSNDFSQTHPLLSEFDQFTVWGLVSWPSLPDLLLQEDGPHIIRICALLARRPVAGLLIPAILDIPPEVSQLLVDFLAMNGHISPMGVMDAAQKNSLAQTTGLAMAPDEASLLGKTWQWLVQKWRF